MSGDPADGGADLDRQLAALQRERLDEQHKRSSLPLLGPSLGIAADGPWELVDLADEEAWRVFSDRFIDGKQGNLKPWFRCIGVLRGHGARTAVVERHYVCLDYRSEFASFYAHLDATRRNATVRIHFFDRAISEERILRLDDDDTRSYLGYIVCREGDLPLVGRSCIRIPSYITESTVIEEPVNLFGQHLVVLGVPFMQQDQRFASCAHVAVWILGYTAFRRGLSERRLMAELVDFVGPVHPMRPRSTEGMTEQQAMEAAGAIGLAPAAFGVANPRNLKSYLPHISIANLPTASVDRLRSAMIFNEGNESKDDVVESINFAFEDYIATVVDESDRPSNMALSPTADAVRALHDVLDHLLRPYIRSGWPVYAATRDHAVTICGRAEVDGAPVYFVHDDQTGPYLMIESLPAASKRSLNFQSGRLQAADSLEVESSPPVDRLAPFLTDGGPLEGLRGFDSALGVERLVVAPPARVLLNAPAAVQNALLTMTALADVVASVEVRSTILMGIDFKGQRKVAAQSTSDDVADFAYSTVHLAEWVIVVEGLDSHSDAVWEFVYDASSSSVEPLLQLSRIGRSMSCERPSGITDVASFELDGASFPSVRAPLRLGKTGQAN